MSEADEIVVLDTGSTDNTVKLLSSFPNVKVYSEKIEPWRFDTARNLSLEKVSENTDYCVCTDLDEVFSVGWREHLEKVLQNEPDKVSYRYIWSKNADGSENTVFNIEKIHRRHGFMWTHPVHEVLTSSHKKQIKSLFCEGITLEHHPDNEKSRAQYLPLLELSVKEAPEDDRNMHYLGREYMFYKRYDEAIDTLKKHLGMKTALWKDERCASMRYIADCYGAKGEKQEELLWLLRACCEAPFLREPWMQTAEYFYKEKNWHGVITFINRALEINIRSENYISSPKVWSEYPYDLISIAYFYTGDNKKASINAKKALLYSPDNERIKKNLSLFI